MRVITKKYPKGIKVVGLILSKEKNKIVLIERRRGDKHYYVFPGGGIDDADLNPKSALLREIKEETNIEVRVIAQPYELRIRGHTKQIVYVCEYLKGEIKLIGEELNKNCPADFYQPGWYEVVNLINMKVYPLEIRDWLIRDLEAQKWIKRKIEIESFDDLRN